MNTQKLSRREFLRDVGISGGVVLSSLPLFSAFAKKLSEEAKGGKAKIAIIGTGSRGMYHINHLLQIPQADVVAICDIYQPHLDDAAKAYPKAKQYKNYIDAINDPNVEGVLIATPLNMHAPITLAALHAGKHAFCEKAMARTIDECKEIYDTYKESGKVLYIGLQRLFDKKYLKAIDIINRGEIGEVVDIRNFWYRNNDWRRPVPEPSLEKLINWRLYKESSGGLMTELAAHQLQLGTWIYKTLPDYICGFGDIIFWKDGREVPDSVSVIYHYPNGKRMTFESIISNKRYGMDEEILGHKGTIELAKGLLYKEEPAPAPGIQQLINQIEHKVFDNVSFAGPSWVPETVSNTKGEPIMKHLQVHDGSNTTGADVDDGSKELVEAYCNAVITGKSMPMLVEEAYYSGILALLGNQAMEQRQIIEFPQEYKIPYDHIK
ncbi:MAG: Gfo/Idh/MocA family protein [Phocaeicola sp.]|uniref:Gfo/Idh/MocA family protein n=1 Tax=Phocaeicola sp. TaxID=2773926 RepID=UPI003F9FD9C7